MSKEPNAVCQRCGVAFHVKPSALSHTKYCSKACHDASQRKGIEAPCFTCGKPVYLSPSEEIWERHFCSKECRTTWLKKHITDEVNVPGHSAGHKAPHLTALNIERNPKLALEADAVKRGTYTDHRRIMEQHLGRKLRPWEDVHHINGIRDDNRIENLVVISHREHMRLHWRQAKERGVI